MIHAVIEQHTCRPRIALQTLLRQAKPLALRELVGPSTIDVLQGLDPDLASGHSLGELASRLVEPSEALRDPEKRNQIIRLLPLPKARELATKLGADDGRALYENLCRIGDESASLPVLFSFFGVVRDERAPSDPMPSASTVAAGYGMFDHQRVAATKIIRVLANPPCKAVLHMPTGSGKTRTAMHIVASHLKQNEPTLVCWLAQNAELLDQASDEFENSWRFLGNRPVNLVRFWGHRNPNILEATDGLIVAGLGKISALDDRDPATLLRLADRVSLTIIDEAHQAIAPTYEAILTALHTKRPQHALLGLTATPGRTWSDIAEDQKLSDYFEGRKVTLEVEGYNDPVSFLTDQGYLARPVFRTLNSEAGLDLSENDVQV